MDSASLASTTELHNVCHLGWHADGACRGGGKCDLARSQTGSNVPGSCTAPQLSQLQLNHNSTQKLGVAQK